ncbi:MAG: hypothetical protein NC418_03515 [Muribaculaceae bacterium]|nr:hypothetical protein [Muribaculaceae bacterium]
MRAFLLFVSLLALCVAPLRSADTGEAAHSVQRYNFSLDTGKAYLSGIMIVSESDDAITGSMINSFGISALDFRYDKASRKVKLLSVVSFLDKWYIRRVLREDIKYCLHVLYLTPYKKKHDYVLHRTVDVCTIENSRRHLTYSFSPLTTNQSEENDTQR